MSSESVLTCRRRDFVIFSLLFVFSCDYVASQNITNFQSAGVYFQHKGELLSEVNSLTLTSVINLEPYHKSVDVIKNASLLYRSRCIQLDLNCEREYNELTNSQADLVKRLNNIYLILLERPVQRRKRFIGIITGLIGLGFGIGNSIQAKNLAKDVENMRNYMKENFNDISKTLKIQGEAQVELKKQQQNLKGILDIHEKSIEEIFTRIAELEKRTTELQQQVNAIRMTVIFQGLKLDVLTILGKLRELEQWILDLKKNVLHSEFMSPEYITDKMMNHTLISERFLGSPTLSNYAHITKTIAGYAFIVKDLKRIFVNVRIPIYQEKKLNLYKVIEVPVMKDKKVLRISNNQNNYCVISEDNDHYDCISGNHKFTEGEDFYFSNDVADLALLPTESSRLCIIDIFTQKTLDRCVYKTVTQNLEIIKEIEDHKYLFAIRDKTKYNLECQIEQKDGEYKHIGKEGYLQNTGIIYLNPGCNFITDYHETVLQSSNKVVNFWKEKDVFNFTDIQEDLDEKFKNYKTSRRLGMEKLKINFEDLNQLQ